MPSYCSAVNCKNNGFTHPELSFFKFPENRKDINDKWIEAMGRIKWQPTKYSRLCSIHFEENCFFLRKGSRLRLLPDAIPTIFDFRKLKNNRKKAIKYLDMIETDCPDPTLYRLETEEILPKTAKSGQKCNVCNDMADCDVTFESIVVTHRGNVSMKNALTIFTPTESFIDYNEKYICSKCCRKMIDFYWMRFDLNQNETFTKNFGIKSPQIIVKHQQIVEQFDVKINKTDDDDAVIAYCQSCDCNFKISNIATHLIDCKMRINADQTCSISTNNRRLFVCYFCRFLLYQHNADAHLNICSKLNDVF